MLAGGDQHVIDEDGGVETVQRFDIAVFDGKRVRLGASNSRMVLAPDER